MEFSPLLLLIIGNTVIARSPFVDGSIVLQLTSPQGHIIISQFCSVLS